MGGGSSHDFDRWFNKEDRKTILELKPAWFDYISDPRQIAAALPNLDVLYLSNNQPIKVSVFGLNDFALLFSLFVFAGCNDLTPVHPTTVILCLGFQFVVNDFAQESIRGELLIRPRWRSTKELNYQDGSDNYRSTSVRHDHSSTRKLRKLQRLDGPEGARDFYWRSPVSDIARKKKSVA